MGSWSFSFFHEGFLNGAKESHTHSYDGIGRNYNTYNTSASLPQLVAIILVKVHVDGLVMETSNVAE
jgi:hypothetical protein